MLDLHYSCRLSKNKKPNLSLEQPYRQKKGACKLWDISDDNGIFGLINDGILLRTYVVGIMIMILIKTMIIKLNIGIKPTWM